MAETLQLMRVLGGETVLGRARDEHALEARLRRGLPFRALEAFMKCAQLSREQAARIVGIPPRTLARRKDENALPFDEADRVLGVASVFAYATTVLGGVDEAARWLHAPNPALGGVSPLDRLDNTLGRNAVSDELTRIAYGLLA